MPASESSHLLGSHAVDHALALIYLFVLFRS